jgi:hypothetical protein
MGCGLPEHVKHSVQHADAASDGEKNRVAFDKDTLQVKVTRRLCLIGENCMGEVCLHLIALSLVHCAPSLMQPKAATDDKT